MTGRGAPAGDKVILTSNLDLDGFRAVLEGWPIEHERGRSRI